MICIVTLKIGGDFKMCVNCGCGEYDNTMEDERNLVMKDLVDATIAGNDGDAKSFLDEMKKSLERITPGELQKRVDEKKSQNESNPSLDQEDSNNGDS